MSRHSVSPSRRVRPLDSGCAATWAALLGVLLILPSVANADEDLVVQAATPTGVPSVELKLYGATGSGVVLSYVPGTSSNTSLFQLPRQQDVWQWQSKNASNVERLQMSLKADNSLELFDSAGSLTPKIVLKPGNGTVAPEITIGDSPVLTQAAADARYLMPVLGITQLDGNSAQTISMKKATSGNGQDLSIRAGGGVGNNASGGSLYLSSGTSTGATGGNIFFQTPAIIDGNPTAEGAMLTRMYINRFGAVGIGAGAGGGTSFEHFGGLDIAWGGAPGTLVLGAESNQTLRRDSQTKYASIVIPHFRNAQAPVGIASASSGPNESIVDIGAGLNSPNYIRFWTQPLNSSGSGSMRMVIHSNGAVGIGARTISAAPEAIAIGRDASVWAGEAIALGPNATASQWESTALGYRSMASGPTSMALGAYTTASTQNAVAIGVGSTASAPLSFASGIQSVAQGYGQAVLGTFNEAKGNPSVADDPQSEVLIVGSGFQKLDGQGVLQTTRQNALTVKRNGDTQVSGNLKVNGVLRLEPAGDLSMGQFNSSPQP